MSAVATTERKGTCKQARCQRKPQSAAVWRAEITERLAALQASVDALGAGRTTPPASGGPAFDWDSACQVIGGRVLPDEEFELFRLYDSGQIELDEYIRRSSRRAEAAA
jgi:hypothetical protein